MERIGDILATSPSPHSLADAVYWWSFPTLSVAKQLLWVKTLWVRLSSLFRNSIHYLPALYTWKWEVLPGQSFWWAEWWRWLMLIPEETVWVNNNFNKEVLLERSRGSRNVRQGPFHGFVIKTRAGSVLFSWDNEGVCFRITLLVRVCGSVWVCVGWCGLWFIIHPLISILWIFCWLCNSPGLFHSGFLCKVRMDHNALTNVCQQ